MISLYNPYNGRFFRVKVGLHVYTIWVHGDLGSFSDSGSDET